MSSPEGIWSDEFFGANEAENQPDCTDREGTGRTAPQPVPQQLGQRSLPDQFALLTGQSATGIDPLQQQLGQAQAALKAVTDKLTGALTGTLAEAQAHVDQCHSNMCGCFDLTCDEVQKVVSKCHRKIDELLVLKLATVYNLLARFGVAYRPAEDVQSVVMGDTTRAVVPGSVFVPQTAQASSLAPVPAVTGDLPVTAGAVSGASEPLQGVLATQAGQMPECLPVRLCSDPADNTGSEPHIPVPTPFLYPLADQGGA
jgi:hypothetical protein